MLASALIVFREVLEAALILSIVAAATKMVPRRNRWLGLGVCGGILAALVVAAFASQIAEAMEGVGQEIFNAGVLLVAVAMLGWHNIWMQQHGRELAARLRDPLETAVRKLAFEPALAWGIPGRGLLRPGWWADVNVIDLGHLDVLLPEIRHDLPASSEPALVVATVVSFVVGYASIAFLLRYLRTHTTSLFVVYRIVVGLLANLETHVLTEHQLARRNLDAREPVLYERHSTAE